MCLLEMIVLIIIILSDHSKDFSCWPSADGKPMSNDLVTACLALHVYSTISMVLRFNRNL